MKKSIKQEVNATATPEETATAELEQSRNEVVPRVKREVKGLNERATAIFLQLVEGLKWAEEDSQRCRKYDNAKGSFQALHVEVIYGWKDGSMLVSLAHYGECNGDLMKDPDMTFVVSAVGRTEAEGVVSPEKQVYPCTYQNDWMGVFQSFMSKEADGLRISNPRQYRDACDFTATWMDNVVWQQNIVLKTW